MKKMDAKSGGCRRRSAAGCGDAGLAQAEEKGGLDRAGSAQSGRLDSRHKLDEGLG